MGVSCASAAIRCHVRPKSDSGRKEIWAATSRKCRSEIIKTAPVRLRKSRLLPRFAHTQEDERRAIPDSDSNPEERVGFHTKNYHHLRHPAWLPQLQSGGPGRVAMAEPDSDRTVY